MHRIERNDDTDFALKILSWIFRAQRTLKMQELLEALAVQDTDTQLDREFCADPHDIIDCCQSLVTHDERTDSVQFAHSTVQQFLASAFAPPLLTHVALARTCLTYLNFEVFESGPCGTRETLDKRIRDYRLSEYASKYWSFHTQRSSDDACVVRAVWDLLDSETKKDSMLQLRSSQENNWSVTYSKGRTPLHILVQAGLEGICKSWLDLRNGKTVPELNYSDKFRSSAKQSQRPRSRRMHASSFGHRSGRCQASDKVWLRSSDS